MLRIVSFPIHEGIGEDELRFVGVFHTPRLMADNEKKQESDVKSHLVVLLKSRIPIGYPPEIRWLLELV